MSTIAAAHPIEALAFQRLRELTQRQRDTLRQAVEAAERRRSLLHRSRIGARPAPHPIALTPFIIPERLVPRLARLAASVYRFQTQAPQLYRTGTLGFREICPLDETTEAWLLRYATPGLEQHLMIRLDVGLTADGRPTLYETNSTALAGLANHSTGVAILRRTVFPRLFAPGELRGLNNPPDLLAFTLRWVKETARRLGLPRGKRLGVALVEPAAPVDGYSEIPAIARYFAANGLRAVCGAPEQLRLSHRGVALSGLPVDLAYREAAFSDLGKPASSGRRLAGFVELLKRGAVIPGFAGEFDHKGILECLTSEAYRRLFTAREFGMLRTSVPWTRVLREVRTDGPDGEPIDLLRFVRAEKDRLLIKPNHGSGGEGILLGRESTVSRWEERVERALREPGRWVVQERVAAVRKPMVYLQNGELRATPCYFSLGLFYVRARLGLHCRVSRFEVVNVGRGGALACVFLGR